MKVLITIIIALSALAACTSASENDTKALRHCLDRQFEISARANNAVKFAHYDKVEVSNAVITTINCASSQFARFVPPAPKECFPANVTTLTTYKPQQSALVKLKTAVREYSDSGCLRS
ncbi:hypothetical protein BGZ47_008664 [Haplosporangium gracile]|nr:hypothetical protein BGZ47_008664 [Haplosporangium gracile]